jgi:hypothetical protein
MKAQRWMWLAVAMSAGAALGEEVHGASRRSFFFEAKVAPYFPEIDSHFATKPGPYEKVFGNTFLWLGEAELDFQFFQKFGTLAVGVSAGYAEKYGKAFVASSGETASESTAIHLVPIKALLVYRFDWLNQKHGIPLVPYVKGGPVIMPWWVTKGPDVEVVGELKGAGYKLGLAGTVGLSLCLDFLDPRLARDFDISVGVNHSYIFAEWTYQNMVLFEPSSNTSPLDLSSKNFTFGLGLEF